MSEWRDQRFAELDALVKPPRRSRSASELAADRTRARQKRLERERQAYERHCAKLERKRRIDRLANRAGRASTGGQGMKSRWRQGFAPIISDVLKRTNGETEAQIRKALKDAYPLCERSHHPYKVWLSEIKRQRGGKRVVVITDTKNAWAQLTEGRARQS